MTKKLEWTFAALLTLLALTLHIARFQHAGALWRDEAAAVALATQPTLGAVFQSFPHEAFPMVFPTLLRGWVALTGGSSGGGGIDAGDTALRAFGLLVGIALLAALWWNAWRLRRAPALVSLALLAASPPFFQFGDAVRGYGLGSLFLLLTFGALGVALTRPSPWGWRTVAGVALPALLAAHTLIPAWPLLLALLGAAVAVILDRRGRQGWREAGLVVMVGLAVGLSLLADLGPLRRARAWQVVVTSPSPIGSGEIWSGFAETAGAPIPAMRWLWVLLAAVAVASTVWLLRRRNAGAEEIAAEAPRGGLTLDLALYGLLALAASTVGYFVFLKLLGYSPRDWYYLPFLILLASILDLLLAGLPAANGGRIAVAGVALAVGLMLAVPAWDAALQRQTNVDFVAREVARAAGPDDLIVVNPWYDGVSFARYYARAQGKVPWITLPEIADHRFHRYDLLKEQLATDRPIDGVLAKVAATLHAGHRLWIVGGVHVPPRGRRPLMPPPAPQTRMGWFDVPYEVAWSQQLGSLLQRHALKATPIAIEVPGTISDYEHLRLLAFDGWR